MKIALIGRSNVGKSSIFNRLVGKRLAIVNDVFGVTRDRRESAADVAGMHFFVTDTPGVSSSPKDELSKGMNEQSYLSVKEADLVCLVIDSQDGVTEYDKSISRWLRNVYKDVGNKSTIVIANKSENLTHQIFVENLGFGEAIYISAEHNIGVQDLYSELSKHIEELDNTQEKDESIKIAIAGRPNVGKSTLVNSLLGESRVLTGEIAGTTRDSIEVDFTFRDHKLKLIDTAGQRRQAKVEEDLEAVSILDAWRYIRQAHAVIVVIDANIPLEKQDLNIARKVEEEGKIVVFAINKIDTVSSPNILMNDIISRLKKEFAQIPNVPCIEISAKSMYNLDSLICAIVKRYETWSSRVKTSELNKFLETAVNNYYPPLVNGHPIKLKYMSQTNLKPPTFTIFTNRGDHLPESYKRYLLNRLRETFDLFGIPLRLYIRTRKNPYAKK